MYVNTPILWIPIGAMCCWEVWRGIFSRDKAGCVLNSWSDTDMFGVLGLHEPCAG